mmetsp:Transcript_22604/g.45673  ORF Transcript_22604/g.45673 Transcript_22604/m.45673 type:complete len:202 (+) Transcript_22604:211-816(+)
MSQENRRGMAGSLHRRQRTAASSPLQVLLDALQRPTPSPLASPSPRGSRTLSASTPNLPSLPTSQAGDSEHEEGARWFMCRSRWSILTQTDIAIWYFRLRIRAMVVLMQNQESCRWESSESILMLNDINTMVDGVSVQAALSEGKDALSSAVWRMLQQARKSGVVQLMEDCWSVGEVLGLDVLDIRKRVGLDLSCIWFHDR